MDALHPRMSTVDPDRNPLTHLRVARRWSLHDLAVIAAGRQLPASARQLAWRWEQGIQTGQYIPQLASQLRLAAAVGVTREQVLSHPWPRWLLLTDDGQPSPLGLEWTTGNTDAVLGQALTSVGMDMDRRGFLILSGVGLAVIAGANMPEPVTRGLDGARIGDEFVDIMHSRLEGLWRLDDMRGGGACLPSALGDLQTAYQTLQTARYSAAIERQIYGLIASLGRFCGWVAFDSGRHAAAQQLWHAALRAAHTAGDSTQYGYTLSNFALQSVYVEAGHSAVAQLEAARAVTDPAHRVMHAMLDCWQGRAHAVRGEHRQAAQLLNRADDTFDRRVDGDDPSCVYWLPVPSLTSEAGAALTACGDYDQALQRLTEGMRSRPVGARDRTLYRVRLAELGLATGDLDMAMHHGQAAVAALADDRIRSHRVSERVDVMLEAFPAGDPRTVALLDQVREQRQLTAA